MTTKTPNDLVDAAIQLTGLAETLLLAMQGQQNDDGFQYAQNLSWSYEMLAKAAQEIAAALSDYAP